MATFPGVVLATVTVLLLPVGLLILYRQLEFIETGPFGPGVLAGILFVGVPLWVAGGPARFFPEAAPGLLLVGLLALGKGVLGEAGKKVVTTVRGYGRGKWVHFMPLGLGFFWGMTVSLFGRMLVLGLISLLGRETVLSGSTDVQWLLGLTRTEMLLFNLFLLGLLFGEVAITLINGLSANKSRIGLFFLALLLAGAYPAVPLLLDGNPWLQGGWFLLYLAGGWLVRRLTRDLFSVFVKPTRNFKGLQTFK